MQIIRDRRALHQIPELDRDLPKTLAYLRRGLSGCRMFSPMEGALCAFFDFGREKTLAFRSDMDGLPIQEAPERVWGSRHPGRMHACGHDGHMAILLELGRWLQGQKSLPYNVLLVFQPAEETTGGAKELCDRGVLGEFRVAAIFGLHIWPGLPEGAVFSRPGPMMSASAQITVDIFGEAAHITRPGRDALAAGAEFYRRAAAREQGALVHFGLFRSGTVCNALAAHTHLEGTLRCPCGDALLAQTRRLQALAEALRVETGCPVTLEFSQGYPAVNNPRWLYDRVCQVAQAHCLEDVSLLTEDFACYQQQVPGLFFFLGAGEGPALHSSHFDFPEGILQKGAQLWKQLCLSLEI